MLKINPRRYPRECGKDIYRTHGDAYSALGTPLLPSPNTAPGILHVEGKSVFSRDFGVFGCHRIGKER